MVSVDLRAREVEQNGSSRLHEIDSPQYYVRKYSLFQFKKLMQVFPRVRHSPRNLSHVGA